MAEQITRIMTQNPRSVSRQDTVISAARIMRDEGIGVVVVKNGDETLNGLLTDRDITTRCVAEALDPGQTMVGDICSQQVAMLRPDDSDEIAVERMREHAVRRLPIVDSDGAVLGIVSMGDLAKARDPRSALAEVSSAPPNN